MRAAYVDTSCLVAVAFGEEGSESLAVRLLGFDRCISANLLEAELSAAFVREGVTTSPAGFLAHLDWVHPDRPLTPEIGRILRAGYVRGADLWHLACALYLSPTPEELHFLTLDRRQQEVAEVLGFQVAAG